MKIIKTWGGPLTDVQARQIAAGLQQGELMVWPTDTLYGVACAALDAKAVATLCTLKGINPQKSTLSIACSSIGQAAQYARWDNWAFSLLKELTPGPYTFIMRASSALPKAFKGRKTVGIRIPDCEIDRQIIDALDAPIATSSVDFDDSDYLINPELMAEAYDGKAEWFVDNGEGLTEPSTVIDCTGAEPVVLRLGKGPVDI